MSLAKNIKKGEKFNIVVGDYIVKKMGLPSRCNLAKFFSIKFDDELKEKINDMKSFTKISQIYLDSALGNRESLIQKIEELYEYKDNIIIEKKSFIDFENIETLIRFDYDTCFESFFSEELEEVKTYKVFGDLNQSNKMMITFQDLRKYKILTMYKEYLDNLTSEFLKRETLILGDDFEDSDFLEFLDYLLKRDKENILKPIYFLSSKEQLDEKIENFILENSITLVKVKSLEDYINSEELTEKLLLEEIIKIEEAVEELKEPKEESIEESMEIEKEVEKEVEQKEILTLVESDGIFFETAAEMRFRSMKLEENPICYSNIDVDQEMMKSLKLRANSIKIGDLIILGVKIRLFGDDNLKFLEIKTREFKIKTSVRVARNGEVYKDGTYLEYEIYSVNNVRFKQLLDLFAEIFTGKEITFKSDNLDVKINLVHILHEQKFKIIKEAERTYEEFFKGTVEEKKFYSTTLSYYQIFLLNSYIRKTNYESWANFVLDEKIDFVNNSGIVAIRDHKIKFPEGFGILREKIQLLEPVEVERVLLEDGKSKLKHAKIKITLEKIS
ncbi:MAG: SIR2 family protein [Fusobacteriaceae bacterium]